MHAVCPALSLHSSAFLAMLWTVNLTAACCCSEHCLFVVGHRVCLYCGLVTGLLTETRAMACAEAAAAAATPLRK
jgi:hypothetical protein